MKRVLYLYLCAVMATMAACTSVDVNNRDINDYAPLVALLEGDDTRIQLNAATKSVWTEGDEVSVFYRSDANQRWEYRGKTGQRTAELYAVEVPTATVEMENIVVAYPYNSDYIIEPKYGDLEAELPSVLHYLDGSYGVGENIMVAQSDSDHFKLRSICGWIKIQLTGNGERVTTLRLIGNNNEQITGPVYIETTTADMIVAAEEDPSHREIILDCGEGVELSDKVTSFLITLPPQSYTKGISVAIECNDGAVMNLATSKPITIERNHIQPMAVISFVSDNTPSIELYYDNLDGQEATKTYGSGSSWPYVDQFSGFANAQGPAAGNITYSGYGVSVRNNANSNGKYSDYNGSGLNNIFFGNNAHLTVENIELSPAQRNLHLEFGAEKYLNNGDSYLSTDEFKVSISDDGYIWHNIEYTFAGTEPGRWNIASAEFTIDYIPESLYIKFEATVAQAYRIDDIRLTTGKGGQRISFSGITDDDDDDNTGSTGGDGGDSTEGDNPGEGDDTTTKGTCYRRGWYELPSEADSDKDGCDDTNSTYYYAHHLCAGGESNAQRTATARNYSVCYSSEHHCPMWVAAPRHSMYEGSSGRNDSYKSDPQIPTNIQLSSKSTGGGCNKGHMLGSAERTSSTATNKQVFYYSNIAPQYSDTFNTGGGAWNNLEDHIDDLVCRDTLYEVVGCYFERYTDKYGNTGTTKKISFGGRSDVSLPTMFYYALLRTKSGNTGKSVAECTADELQCAAFVICHEQQKGHKPESRDIISIEELEALTGFSYFDNVPNAPKSVVNAADWL